MSQLKQFIHEIHRRSIWQVLAIYLGAAWVAYEAIQGLTEGLGLPGWFPGFAVVLFIAGLPIVLATAFVQEGGPVTSRPAKKPSPSAESVVVEAEAATAPIEPTKVVAGARAIGARRYLTWRNVLLAGLVVFAAWGIISAAWLLMTFPGLVVKAEAADFFGERDRVLVAEFANRTEQAALALAIRTAIETDLDQSDYVNVVDRSELDEALERMRLPDTVHIDTDLALEIARREGYPAVVTGTVTPLGTGYQLGVQIIEASSGDVAVRLTETAANDAGVIPATERLARLTRRHLGESLTGLRRSKPLPRVTTASLAALEHYARGRDYSNRGDIASAISQYADAVRLDTAFAAAYAGLGVRYGSIGDPAGALTSIDKAYRFAERLVDRERYYTGALYHGYRGQLDSAAYYYELLLDIDPNHMAGVNNLGDIYENMGRYEEALSLYRRAVAIEPSAIGYSNVASAARTLGLHEAADSALAIMEERYPDAYWTRITRARNALYAGDFDTAEQVARAMAYGHSALELERIAGRQMLAGVQAARGRVSAALALADTTAELARGSRSPFAEWGALRRTMLAALAAGMPERAAPFLGKMSDPETFGPSRLFYHLALSAQALGHYLAGNSVEAKRLLARADSLVELGGFRPIGVDEQLRALIALEEGRAEAALDYIRRARELDFGYLRLFARLELGDAYAALGRLRDAAAQYDSLTSTYRLNFTDVAAFAPLLPLAHERAGAVYLALGDTTAALEHLAAFTELWRDADPELQPRVESAQHLMERLTGENR